MKHWYLARHGETNWNVQKIVQGFSCGGLTEKGFEQGRALGVLFMGAGIEYILSGTSLRHVQTTEGVLQYITATVLYTPALRERGCGDMEGKPYDNESEFDFFAGNGHGRFAGVEPLELALARAREVIETVQALPYERVLSVGSGWINSYILWELLRQRPKEYYPQDHCHYHNVVLDGARLMSFELNQNGILVPR